MMDETTRHDAPRISDADKSYYLSRAAAESSIAANAAIPIAVEVHAALALAYLHRVLCLDDNCTNTLVRGGRF